MFRICRGHFNTWSSDGLQHKEEKARTPTTLTQVGVDVWFSSEFSDSTFPTSVDVVGRARVILDPRKQATCMCVRVCVCMRAYMFMCISLFPFPHFLI